MPTNHSYGAILGSALVTVPLSFFFSAFGPSMEHFANLFCRMTPVARMLLSCRCSRSLTDVKKIVNKNVVWFLPRQLFQQIQNHSFAQPSRRCRAPTLPTFLCILIRIKLDYISIWTGQTPHFVPHVDWFPLLSAMSTIVRQHWLINTQFFLV